MNSLQLNSFSSVEFEDGVPYSIRWEAEVNLWPPDVLVSLLENAKFKLNACGFQIEKVSYPKENSSGKLRSLLYFVDTRPEI